MDKFELIQELQQAKDKLEAEKNYRNRIIDIQIVAIDAVNAAHESIEKLIHRVIGEGIG